MNLEIGTDPNIPFLGIFVSKFRYFVFAVQRVQKRHLEKAILFFDPFIRTYV